MALLSLDRHDVLETIRQSNSLCEAFLCVAKLPAVGEYRTASNADRIRSMTDEELAEWASIREMCFIYHLLINDPDLRNKCRIYENCKDCWLEWLKQEAVDNGACSADETSEKVQEDE